MRSQANRLRALLIVVAVAGAVAKSTASYGADEYEMSVLEPGKLKFEAIPGMPACVTAATLRGNPRFGPAWVLLKLGSDCFVPAHWHTPNEDLVVISGEGRISMRDGLSLEFVPGAYSFLPSGHVHQAYCSRSCLLFNVADAAFDMHFVDEKGEEISSEEALKRAAIKPPAKKAKPKPKPKPKAKK